MTRQVIDRFSGEYAYLSNFHGARFVWNREVWPTLEHAYQAAKLPVHGWERQRDEIRQADTPGQAKRLGRRALLRGGWDDMKIVVMHHLLVAKFHQHPHLLHRLRETGRAALVEGNHWHDNFWGDCRCLQLAQHPECEAPGQNWLGRLLAVVRDTDPYSVWGLPSP